MNTTNTTNTANAIKNYEPSYGFKPISAWGYIGYSFLWAIPFVGWIAWLISALGASNRNVKNYARSYVCAFLVAIMLIGAIFVLALSFGLLANLELIIEEFNNGFNSGYYY